eukprot:m.178102 g.178102  ORF g.178102 m.178102 type:complete len:235 (-) comp15465_c0_seq1:2054-2758(-)
MGKRKKATTATSAQETKMPSSEIDLEVENAFQAMMKHAKLSKQLTARLGSLESPLDQETLYLDAKEGLVTEGESFNDAELELDRAKGYSAKTEKDECIRAKTSTRLEKAIRKNERKKNDNAGKKWFGMPATKITPEIETQLRLTKMRHVLDPKHFMKRDKNKSLPKYFQIGTEISDAADYYADRPSTKRKKTLVDELLADVDFKQYHKRKFTEIQAKRVAQGRQKKFIRRKKKK